MSKNLLNILLFSILLSSCESRTAENYFILAQELEEEKRYNEAIRFLDKVIEIKPDFKPALLNRGTDKSILKNYRGAIKDYELILKYDSDNTTALMNIGNNYKRIEDYQKSVEYYTKALKTKGAINSDSIYLEINFYNELEDKDSDYFIRKFEIEFERGISYVLLNEYQNGIKDLKQAIKYNYDLPNALNWTGLAYYKMNDTLNARKFLTEASKHGFIDAKELLKKIK